MNTCLLFFYFLGEYFQKYVIRKAISSFILLFKDNLQINISTNLKKHVNKSLQVVVQEEHDKKIFFKKENYRNIR